MRTSRAHGSGTLRRLPRPGRGDPIASTSGRERMDKPRIFSDRRPAYGRANAQHVGVLDAPTSSSARA
jgi:hypothetical protein